VFILKNKKAMLLASETLKMVLAVICLGFLVYLLVSVYYANADSKELEHAKATIDRIESSIKDLDLGIASVRNITEITPAGWVIFSYTGNEKKPNFCSRENCICICDDYFNYFGISKDRPLKKCGEEGACLIVENLKEFEDIEITKPGESLSVSFTNVDSFIEVKII